MGVGVGVGSLVLVSAPPIGARTALVVLMQGKQGGQVNDKG